MGPHLSCVGVIAEEATRALHKHYDEAAWQRDKLYDHAYKAKNHPGKYASFMLDGMTKRLTALPKHKVKLGKAVRDAILVYCV